MRKTLIDLLDESLPTENRLTSLWFIARRWSSWVSLTDLRETNFSKESHIFRLWLRIELSTFDMNAAKCLSSYGLLFILFDEFIYILKHYTSRFNVWFYCYLIKSYFSLINHRKINNFRSWTAKDSIILFIECKIYRKQYVSFGLIFTIIGIFRTN